MICLILLCVAICIVACVYACAGFLSGNASRGGKFSHEEYVGGKSKALQITVYPKILTIIKFGDLRKIRLKSIVSKSQMVCSLLNGVHITIESIIIIIQNFVNDQTSFSLNPTTNLIRAMTRFPYN